MRRLPHAAPRRLPWPLRSVESARTRIEYDRFGRMLMHIDHALLRDLTPRMVAFWFANIDGTMEIAGETHDRYLAWHPLDHIRWELVREAPGGGAAAGARFRIVEAFGRDEANYIDVVEDVLRLDASGLTLVNRKAGIEVSRLQHDFIAAEGGTRYVSTLTIGVALPVVGRAVNAAIRRSIFSEAKGRAWIRHNVEEVGLLEHLLPLLLAQLRPAAPAG